MQINLRQETSSDYNKVFKIIELAFKSLTQSDHKEQFLVERLRKSDAFIPQLSIVAELENEIVGHVLLTRVFIENGSESIESLALAPVSVMPRCQGKGIGTKLIIHSHNVAKELGFKSVIVLGHRKYYPRFGYKQTSKYTIEMPFDAPAESCMIIALTDDGLLGVTGKVKYPKEFFE